MYQYVFLKPHHITNALVQEINQLFSQLTSSTRVATKKKICEAIKYSYFLVAFEQRHHGKPAGVCGMATLVPLHTALGLRGSIEDVVVDERYRGKGIGTILVMALLKKAQKEGMRCIQLTSHPKRLEAHRLYEKLGFYRYDTYFYLYDSQP